MSERNEKERILAKLGPSAQALPISSDTNESRYAAQRGPKQGYNGWGMDPNFHPAHTNL